MPDADLVIIGAGAAGLAAAIFAGEALAGTGRGIVLLEGARKPGAKILVSGGGRCNVTNREVTPEDYCGGPKPIIRNVLRAFDERRTLEWMASLGVELKLEPTGKYFPVSDKARTVLDALLKRASDLGVDLRSGTRVASVHSSMAVSPMTDQPQFQITFSDAPPIHARRLVLATGGLALPKSGSDGAGLQWMRALGHSIVPTTPALAPLVLDEGAAGSPRLTELAGMTLDIRLALGDPAGRRLAEFTGSTVLTHFGMSGPAPMNLSRHVARYLQDNRHPPLATLGHPDFPTPESADTWLRAQIASNPKRQANTALEALFPERLARIIAGDDVRLTDLSRERRLALSRRIAALPIPVTGDRGYSFAETTAGGVDLREVDARTMASRVVPGLHLCGEMLDVDGRIGGFNFQWAWASGYLAGRGAARAITEDK